MSASLSGVAAAAAFYVANGWRGSDLASRREIDSIPLKAYLTAGAVGVVAEVLQHAVLGYSIQNKPVIQTIADTVSSGFNMVYGVAQFSAKAVMFTVDTAATISKGVGHVGSFVYHAAIMDDISHPSDSHHEDDFSMSVGHSQYNETPTHVDLAEVSVDALHVPSLIGIDLHTYA